MSKYQFHGKQINNNSVNIGGENNKLNPQGTFDMGTHGLKSEYYPTEGDDLINLDFFNNNQTIGEAEDGDYSDGIFTDFVPTTPIGTAVDRFNELFTALVPPLAPILSDWDAYKTGDVSGKLSFDSDYAIATYSDANTLYENVNPSVGRNDSWTISGKRLGIAASNSGDITGTLNYQVAVGSGDPTAAYVADSFSDAQEGTLGLYLNGVLISSIDLTNLSAINNTVSSTVSGFSISSAYPSYFPSGASLEAVASRNRTGTWLLVGDDPNIRNGYNYVIVKHESNRFNRVLTRFEWIQDDSTTATAYSGESLHDISLTGSKYLSGVNYYTGGTALYDITIQNAYRNTYSLSSTAISHTGTNCTCPSQAIPSLDVGDTNESDITLTDKTVTINSGIRILGGSISCLTNVLRTLQTSPSSTGSSISEILLDSVSETSTLVNETFRGETYRLKSDSSYDLITDITTNTWSSTESLVDAGNSGYNNGLQVVNDLLMYPSVDYSILSNAPISNVDYSGCTGIRYYYRYFRQVSPTTANFIMNIQGSGGTFVATETALTGNNIHVHIKAPSETGWLDCYKDFATGVWTDDSGARNSTNGGGRAFNTSWGLTIGTKNTANTSGYMVIRISVAEGFTGYLSNIGFTFS